MSDLLTVPKSLAAAADELFKTEQKRLSIQKTADDLKSRETFLRDYLIQNLPKSDATGVAGKFARVSIKETIVYNVADWDKVYAYVLANAKKTPGVWALLQRRLGSKAAGEMFDAGKPVPGTARVKIPVVSMSKL